MQTAFQIEAIKKETPVAIYLTKFFGVPFGVTDVGVVGLVGGYRVRVAYDKDSLVAKWLLEVTDQSVCDGELKAYVKVTASAESLTALISNFLGTWEVMW